MIQHGNDSGPGSLGAGIASANDGKVVTFAISGTIMNLTGELLVNKSLDIVGHGPSNLAVNGNNASRVLNIAGGGQRQYSRPDDMRRMHPQRR